MTRVLLLLPLLAGVFAAGVGFGVLVIAPWPDRERELLRELLAKVRDKGVLHHYAPIWVRVEAALDPDERLS